MEAIFSSAALRNNQREVKNAALEDVVHITENGNGAFVFCSEEVFERRLRQAAEDALYASRMEDAIEAGRADVGAGRVYHGAEAAFAEVARRRSTLG